MKTLRLPRLTPAFGEIVLPGSKSLSNRILLLSALAQGKTKITNLLDSDDVRHMLDALKLLGVEYTLSDDRTECHLTGQDGPFNAQDITLYLGNAGTAMRPLTAALCFADGGNFELTGLPRMYERPIGDLVTPLRELGAEIEYLQETGYPPLKIAGKQLTGGEVSVSGAVSSQFLSALLMAGPLFSEGLTVNIEGTLVSKPYIDITINCLKLFGIETQRTGYEQFVIAGGQQYRSPEQVMIEGDASSASYFLAAAAISGGKVKVLGTGTNSVQGDKEFAQVLKLMGAEVNAGPDWIEVTGTGPLQGIDVDLNAIPDAAMTIAVAALFASGTTTIRNIYNWRVKETDRLTAMATELRKVGAEVIEGEDFITITPPAEINPATIDTYDDHRMAMCFSLVAYAVDGVVINDPDCTHKTYPGYFDDLASLSQ